MPKEIFITGPNSLVGATVVGKLLKETDARLWLMVRKRPDQPDLYQRVRRALAELPEPVDLDAFSARVVIFKGDLMRRQMGISDAIFQRLNAAAIDEIVHLASLAYNPLLEKDQLFSINFDGTNKLINLAKRLKVKVFNHLGHLYSCQAVEGGASPDNYLELFQKEQDFNNLNEFVQQLTLQTVIKRTAQLGMRFRAINPGFLMEPGGPCRLEAVPKRWYYRVLKTIFDIETAYLRLGLDDRLQEEGICWPSREVKIYLSCPYYVGQFIFHLLQDGERSYDYCYNLYNCAPTTHDLWQTLKLVKPTLRIKVPGSREIVPYVESLYLKRAIIFFEYLFQHRRFAVDPHVERINKSYAIPSPDFSDRRFADLVGVCYRYFQSTGLGRRESLYSRSVLRVMKQFKIQSPRLGHILGVIR